ncbi:MAG: fibronectin type III domain-containing protein [Verrucomicrobiae bacterium]|nr:fibronectin type III domain-containing protein [Verrucomicrobiae bacterium]
MKPFVTVCRSAGASARWWSVAILALTLSAGAAPRHVYLTWQGDPSRTMTVNYQTWERGEASSVYYDVRPRGGRPEAYRYRAQGSAHQIPGLEDGRWIHWVELTGLKPGRTYYFIAGDPRNGFSAERQFRTVPSGRAPLRFIVGGDMGVGANVPKLLQHAARLAPDFCVVGGDLAYANGMLTNYPRWDAWLDHWQTNMITPSGLTIPMVLAIGNHEIRRGATNLSPTNAPFFFGYFAQDRHRSYRSLTFGRNLVVLILDSGHAAAHDGPQAAWLEDQLARHRHVPYRMAVYHVPLYPSHRAYDGAGSVKGRDVWLPLFDRYRLTTAFEHHDHTFKRTHLLRHNQPDPQGTLYLGDGCLGMPARSVEPQLRWYLVKAASLEHFWCVDINRRGVEYRAYDLDGRVFDVYPPTARGAAEAEAYYQTLPLGKRSVPPTAAAN